MGFQFVHHILRNLPQIQNPHRASIRKGDMPLRGWSSIWAHPPSRLPYLGMRSMVLVERLSVGNHSVIRIYSHHVWYMIICFLRSCNNNRNNRTLKEQRYFQKKITKPVDHVPKWYMVFPTHTLGRTAHSQRILGWYWTKLDRGCSSTQAPPIADTKRISRATLDSCRTC